MTPTQVLTDLMEKGIVLSASGGKLVAEGPMHTLDSDLKATLTRHKAGLLALVQIDWARKASHVLGKISDPERRAALREQFEERIAICTIDGHLPQDEAERIAFEQIRQEVKGAEA